MIVFARQGGNSGWTLFRFRAGSCAPGVTRPMRRACAKAGISPPATFHDLRRSYASLLINKKTDVEVIQKLLGHADLRMTVRAYAHLLDATISKAVKKNLPSFGLAPTNVKKLRG
jgi:integrase